MGRDIPDVTWKQTVAHHTFIPMLVVVFGTAIASLPLWHFGFIPMWASFALPWVALEGACLWVIAFGDGVIPAETYRKRRENRWYHIRTDDYHYIDQTDG